MGNRHRTNFELKKIQKLFQIAPDYYIATLLSGRTALAIAAKRRRLNFKYTWEWMSEEMKKDRISPYAFC